MAAPNRTDRVHPVTTASTPAPTSGPYSHSVLSSPTDTNANILDPLEGVHPSEPDHDKGAAHPERVDGPSTSSD
ncbi:hypothetical protein GCM10010492_05130 [Saccharothrix mutabilis subsp. mutabilis]|uniref:Uncharacterized protein n=1 Tax=Saccharothrix mutabilis subsp. mutabilis TaxID=66855 RepID=A0ABN0T2I4_9PSEU